MDRGQYRDVRQRHITPLHDGAPTWCRLARKSPSGRVRDDEGVPARRIVWQAGDRVPGWIVANTETFARGSHAPTRRCAHVVRIGTKTGIRPRDGGRRACRPAGGPPTPSPCSGTIRSNLFSRFYRLRRRLCRTTTRTGGGAGADINPHVRRRVMSGRRTRRPRGADWHENRHPARDG